MKSTSKQIVEVDRISGLNTVRVVVKDSAIHSKYQKRFGRTNHLLVDSAGFEVVVGDRVEIIESRPISKNKSWVIKSVKDKSK